jgi:hypothetical protein
MGEDKRFSGCNKFEKIKGFSECNKLAKIKGFSGCDNLEKIKDPPAAVGCLFKITDSRRKSAAGKCASAIV